ncbi:bifunctional helix-turn-helix transcriptional regulator/GNAT family N-acetyltransferase [Anaerocolumna sp. AGMB13025]|uniref:bifunctional helix-turn-helix transcriptional regulator/GNAT family N-acetyltransferase n=1 Tax=Anaerocolumna sp. AGMB13025 TaxID=3039116 RepID=UPI00241DC50A|nr:bifunctional helix-turn-helix transcriptional regulator/GNAT family N-acetyltransferase [Anaerocolumna sp. AGMB13025]WFR55754.1 bifunctional helix-turn-helix transcriptional regulator/GNAT family N-acetyltransferase [Anaerocolumna sp. AGMB13025]
MNKEEIVRKEIRLIVRELGLLNHNCFHSDLTLAQAHILNYLKQNGKTPFNELLINLGIDKASLSRIISNLEAKNYLELSKSEGDKRMKDISLLPSGLSAIREGDQKANTFFHEILDLGDPEHINNIVRTLREFHILALKNNLKKNDARIRIEPIYENYMEDAIRLATEVFTDEQGIPAELIPVNDKLNPIWWCARVGEDIIGAAAAWKENDKWHWGRFAVDKGLRGIGIGQKLALYSLNEIFNRYTDELYIEARDVTVTMLKKFGCKVIGEAEEFYDDIVTPIILNKSSFKNHLNSLGSN